MRTLSVALLLILPACSPAPPTGHVASVLRLDDVVAADLITRVIQDEAATISWSDVARPDASLDEAQTELRALVREVDLVAFDGLEAGDGPLERLVVQEALALGKPVLVQRARAGVGPAPIGASAPLVVLVQRQHVLHQHLLGLPTNITAEPGQHEVQGWWIPGEPGYIAQSWTAHRVEPEWTTSWPAPSDIVTEAKHVVSRLGFSDHAPRLDPICTPHERVAPGTHAVEADGRVFCQEQVLHLERGEVPERSTVLHLVERVDTAMDERQVFARLASRAGPRGERGEPGLQRDTDSTRGPFLSAAEFSLSAVSDVHMQEGLIPMGVRGTPDGLHVQAHARGTQAVWSLTSPRHRADGGLARPSDEYVDCPSAAHEARLRPLASSRHRAQDLSVQRSWQLDGEGSGGAWLSVTGEAATTWSTVHLEQPCMATESAVAVGSTWTGHALSRRVGLRLLELR